MDNGRQHLVPNLSEEVAKNTVNGIYTIEAPTAEPGEIKLGENDPMPVVRLRCHSLRTHNPDTILPCNSVIKTIVGKVTGDQMEIIECGRCRTSYIVRTRSVDGKTVVTSAVWNTSRNVNNYCKKLNKDGKYLVKFNRKKG